ncbi:hypothetical protein L2E82_11385 [Cichorium intybus]|uniref:Uncharacterized protein n=1 Tax=Cichorium intybus TaxID=13427 RepID=A0ACB9GD13_CICIN|nr:hypothetical protein L2E82_11385 [Cichorium intybus]
MKTDKIFKVNGNRLKPFYEGFVEEKKIEEKKLEMVKIICTPRKRVIPNVSITSPAPPPPASIATKKEFLRKLRNLRGREIMPSHVLDWELAIETGLDKQLEPLSR